jgi:hypothetical protein
VVLIDIGNKVVELLLRVLDDDAVLVLARGNRPEQVGEIRQLGQGDESTTQTWEHGGGVAVERGGVWA